MDEFTPPRVVAVEVVPTQPTDADRTALNYLSAQAPTPLPEVAYVVKITYEKVPPITSAGWALYVGAARIPKYWGCQGGIYFKVFDPAFLATHAGQPLRFTQDGVEFVETGKNLPEQPRVVAQLLLQAEVLR